MKTLNVMCAALTIASTAGMSLGATATFDYRDLSDTSGLLILKDARLRSSPLDGPVVRLTTNDRNLSGVMMPEAKVLTTAFHTEFTWRVSQVGGAADSTWRQGADGFYLSLGSSSALQAGAVPVLNGSTVLIHFDTFQNPGDPSSNFVSATVGGTTVTGTVARPFDNGDLWYAWVEMEGTTLKVYAAHQETHPLNPTITMHGVDLNALLGPEAHIALGGKTSEGFAVQDVTSWSYTAVPTPGAAALLGLGGLALGRRRRN